MKKYIISLLCTFIGMTNALGQLEGDFNFNNYTLYTNYYIDGTLLPHVYRLNEGVYDPGYANYEAERQNIAAQYNGAQLIGNATDKYNCHAYAWMGTTNYWLRSFAHSRTEHLYVQKGYYYEIEAPTGIPNFNHVVSYYGDHSAVYDNDGWYISKWGYSGLVRHRLNDVPSGYHHENINGKRFFVHRDRVLENTPTVVPATGIDFVLPAAPLNNNLTWNCGTKLQEVGTRENGRIKTLKSVVNGRQTISIYQNGIFIKSKDIWSGTPLVGVSGPSMAVTNDYSHFQATFDGLSQATNFEWLLTPQRGAYMLKIGESCEIMFYEPGEYLLSARASNSAGTGQYYGSYVYVYDGYSNSAFSFYPNPVSDVLTVNVKEAFKSSKTKSAFSAKLYNQQGVVVRQTNVKTQRIDFDVNTLPEGTYYLHIDDGNNTGLEKYPIIVR